MVFRFSPYISVRERHTHWLFPDDMPYGQVKLLQQLSELEWTKHDIEDYAEKPLDEYCQHHLDNANKEIERVTHELKEKYNYESITTQF